jgi:hypothetical protein
MIGAELSSCNLSTQVERLIVFSIIRKRPFLCVAGRSPSRLKVSAIPLCALWQLRAVVLSVLLENDITERYLILAFQKLS